MPGALAIYRQATTTRLSFNNFNRLRNMLVIRAIARTVTGAADIHSSKDYG